MADGHEAIDAAHLQLRGAPREATAPAAEPQTVKPGELDRETIVRTLERCGGNQKAAAQALGVSRGTLIARIAAFGIDRPRKR
jgi:DNA-binding NtrC family response regulator